MVAWRGTLARWTGAARRRYLRRLPLYDHITREVEEGPGGPEIGAFFDLDRTLLAGFSAIAFLRGGLVSGLIRPAAFLQTLSTALQFQTGMVGFSRLVGDTASMLCGIPEGDFEAFAERVFTEQLAGEIYPEARALVHAHLRRGHTVAVVSSATRYQTEPVARALGIPHILCTRLEVRDGRLTGAVEQPTCYGEGKLVAARTLAERRGVELADSWFYTDSDEDLPLLEAVGRPRPTNANRGLAAVAGRRGWPVRQFTSRGLPAVGDVLRTTLAMGSLVPSLLLGVPVALFSGNWGDAINLAATTWGELGTGLAGIDVHVRGREHLWSQRPAVFIFNHQSAVDVLLLCKLLQRDFVGISKQEVRRNPFFGPVFALAGTVFIDRFDREKAVEALKPAVDALRHGLSIAIAPEGTRSTTPRPGRFKKGAFHMAMAAGVPIVPIVFRNALDALPKHGIIVRPTTVEVVVHPPISTEGWKVSALPDRIAEIEHLYHQTLDD